MMSTYTAKYTKIKRGYMGQLVEWPEVITEGKTLEECRSLLQDALREMILAYRQQKKEIPEGRARRRGGAARCARSPRKVPVARRVVSRALIEQIPVEV